MYSPTHFLDTFVPGSVGGKSPAAEALTFVFRDRHLLVEIAESRARILTYAELLERGIEPIRSQFLGHLGDREIHSLEVADHTEPPEGGEFRGLRSLFGALDDAHFWLAARAVQIVAWDRDHQFCGRCATPTERHDAERCRRCPKCGLSHFPRLAPAVIVSVERGDEILLARSPHFIPGMFSTLAGFVEPGETLEHCVAREIREEVGVEVENIRYFGSQPWPFPHSLMVGFRADYAGGEIAVDGVEIEAAYWYRADDLPRIPPRVSIARALIDSFVAKHDHGR